MGESEEKAVKRHKIQNRLSVVMNILVVILAGIGSFITFTDKSVGTGLKAYGFQNLKFFTALSNVFCGSIALGWLIFRLRKKKFPVLLKLMAVSAVGLTFLIVIAFLRPMYPELNFYTNGNLWFHLIVPLMAMTEFILLPEEEQLPFINTVFAAAPVFFYGICYLTNIIIKGVGTWPDTNDWYGFLNWGYPIGILIFAVSIMLEWGMAVLFRFLRHFASKRMKC